MLTSGLINSSIRTSADSERRQAPVLDAPIVDDARAHHRGEHRGEEADHERDREALHRPRAELEEDETRKEGRDVGVENGGQRPRIAGLDRRPDALPEAQLLAD